MVFDVAILWKRGEKKMNKLAMYRKKTGLKQSDLAAKLEVSTRTVVNIEKQEYDLKQLSLNEIERICEVLSIKVSDLVGVIE